MDVVVSNSGAEESTQGAQATTGTLEPQQALSSQQAYADKNQFAAGSKETPSYEDDYLEGGICETSRGDPQV